MSTSHTLQRQAINKIETKNYYLLKIVKSIVVIIVVIFH